MFLTRNVLRHPCVSAVAVVLALVTCGAAVSAQVPQVVQLPSFRTFSYSGSVLVPTQGTAALGSNASVYTGRFRGRRLGQSLTTGQAAGGVQAGATVIDLQSIDQRLLKGTSLENPSSRRAASESKAAATREGKSLVRYARRSYNQGRESVAFEAYRLAIGKLDGRLRQLAEMEFRRMFGESAEQAIRIAELTK